MLLSFGDLDQISMALLPMLQNTQFSFMCLNPSEATSEAFLRAANTQFDPQYVAPKRSDHKVRTILILSPLLWSKASPPSGFTAMKSFPQQYGKQPYTISSAGVSRAVCARGSAALATAP